MIALIVREGSEEFVSPVLRTFKDVGGDRSTAKRLKLPVAKDPEYVIVLGGDGTVLGAEREYPGVPKLNIAAGKLSFLSALSMRQLKHGLEKFKKGEFKIEERMKLSSNFGDALNEITVLSKTPGRMIELKLVIDGKEADQFRGDGILVSTPTGSTAYSLSAGGPILDPSVDGFAIVPVSPFKLASRPIVVGASSVVTIVPKEDAIVTIDGQMIKTINQGEKVVIKKSESVARFVVLSNVNYYKKLKML